MDGRLTVGRETDVDGRLVDGLVPRLLEEVVDGLGRLVDGLVPRLLEEEVVGGRLTVIFPAGLLTVVLPEGLLTVVLPEGLLTVVLPEGLLTVVELPLDWLADVEYTADGFGR